MKNYFGELMMSVSKSIVSIRDVVLGLAFSVALVMNVCVEDAHAGIMHAPSVTPESAYTEYAEMFPASGFIRRDAINLTEPEFGGGGTLIHPQFVLTAAHVVEAINPATNSFYDSFGLGFGDNYFNTPTEFQTASEIIVHPDYNGIGNGPDVALLYFDTPFTSVTPSTLYSGTVQVGDELSMAGYGLPGTPGNLETADGLKRGGVNIIDSVDSPEGYAEAFFLQTNLGGHPLGILATPGDSGNGGYVFADNQFQLAAVASFWSGFPNYFGISSFSYLDDDDRVWIDGEIQSRAEVPEPASAVLLLAASPFVALRRRRLGKRLRNDTC